MLWGRGAVDMKNMDAMIIGALTDILGAGKTPGRDLVIAFFSDEENGGVFGSHYVVDNRPELFAGATEAISEVGGYSVDLNGTRAYLLQTGEKALIWIKLTARGTAAHGSRGHPRQRRHEAWPRRSSRWVAVNGPCTSPKRPSSSWASLPGLMEVDPRRSAPRSSCSRTGTASGFIQASLRTTTNPTVLDAGYKHNVIPDTAEALVDIRCLAGEEDAVLAEVRELVGDDDRARDRASGHRTREPVRRTRWSMPWSATLQKRTRAHRYFRTCCRVAPTTRLSRSSASRDTDSRRCGFPPNSTSPPCSMASTSACRSTHSSSAVACSGTCCATTDRRHTERTV